MNPRLVEPGFAVVCLHADVPARPSKDENREDDAEVARQHGRTAEYLHCRTIRKGDGGIASTDRAGCPPRHRIAPDQSASV